MSRSQPQSPLSLTTSKGLSNSSPQSLLGFVSSTPPPVTAILVKLSGVIEWSLWVARAVNWKSQSPSESWTLLASWWLFCLAFEYAIKYFLPLVFLVPFIVLSFIPWNSLPFVPTRESTSPQLPTTEQTLSRSISSISALLPLLPSLPPFPNLSYTSPTRWSILRLILLLYIPYLLFTYFVPLKVIIALTGTLFLTWRSPWFRVTRHIISNNAWAKLAFDRTMLVLTGLQSPPSEGKTSTVTAQSLKKNDSAAVPDAPPPATLNFKFTILENQRWWVGLDWTAALLPHERPSWSSPSPALDPLSPPISFSLPPSATVLLPLPTKGKEHLRIKRTATWKWVEKEWRVLVKTSPTESASRVGMALPNIDASGDKEASPSRLPETLLSKGLQRAGTFTSHPVVSVDNSKTIKDGHDPASADNVDSRPKENEDEVTDSEGWIYGDNKWEGSSGKGGIGKYTRYRRWSRIASLVETVEVVPAPPPSAEPTDSDIPSNDSNSTESTPQSLPKIAPPPSSNSSGRRQSDLFASIREDNEGDDEKSALRKRLKAAIKGHKD